MCFILYDVYVYTIPYYTFQPCSEPVGSTDRPSHVEENRCVPGAARADAFDAISEPAFVSVLWNRGWSLAG